MADEIKPEALAFIGTSDFSGLLRGRSVPWAALERHMGRGVGIAPGDIMASPFGAAADRPLGGPGDLALVPDAATRAYIPSPGAPDIVLLLGDLLETDGAPWECCPRYFLRRGLAALHAEFGLTLRAAFEQAMVYTGAGAGTGHTLDSLRRQGGFGGTLLATMRANGITAESFHPAAGAGQYVVTIAPAQGVAAADQAVLVRELARAAAALLGQRVLLAPMPTADGVGNGTQIHWSVLDGFGRPAMYDPSGVHGLSDEAEQMAAGVLHHLPAIAAVTAPSAASYFRFQPGRSAPIAVDLGIQDRGSAVRIGPIYATAEEEAAAQSCLEFRVADAACSPYLALGALVWAGLDGLRQGRRLAQAERRELPRSLGSALDEFEESVAIAEWFGPLLRECYLRFKRAELRTFEGLSGAAVCARYASVY